MCSSSSSVSPMGKQLSRRLHVEHGTLLLFQSTSIGRPTAALTRTSGGSLSAPGSPSACKPGGPLRSSDSLTWTWVWDKRVHRVVPGPKNAICLQSARGGRWRLSAAAHREVDPLLIFTPPTA